MQSLRRIRHHPLSINRLSSKFFLTMGLVLSFGHVYAEIKFGMTGQLHSSLQIKGGDTANFYTDRAWFGFKARTPKGFAKLNLQLEDIEKNSSYTNAVPYVIREAYSGFNLSDTWQVTMGMKQVPYGMLSQENNNILGFKDVNYLLGLKQAAGFDFRFKHKQWRWNLGIFSPAYRSQFISTDTEIVNQLPEAPLYTMRLAYQIGKILTVQASFAVQDYQKNSTNNEMDHASRYFDVGFDADFSPLWGMVVNYSEVKHAYGDNRSNARTVSQVQLNWTPNRFWEAYFRTYEVFDKNTNSQLLLYLGAAYQLDKHNRIVVSGNLNSNNKDYEGFLGQQKQSLLIQHQFNF